MRTPATQYPRLSLIPTLSLALSLALSLGPNAWAAESLHDEEAQATIGLFAGNLMRELTAALGDDGPIAAVAVCQERAPAIAAELSADSGWTVGRTSLKVRNPENAPDAWERGVLEQFEARKAAGESVTELTFAEVITDDNGGQTYRVMRAIPTAPLCLTCHGSKIEPDLAQAIDKAYPEDEARGFAEGDIRGAFTLSRPL
ncbi:MAG: DUF3365 domain-containing protein [Chromatiaceae bacterium]|nr:MAG: DUF3365 domain-containing protein [Chromatiaceae bacterium]